MSLNLRAIRAAQVGDVLWDEEVKGLHLRCYADRKVFHLYYRTRAQQQRRPKLGDFGLITLEQARQSAREMLQQARSGHDPKAQWERKKAAATVSQLAERYFREHAAELKSRK